MKRSWKCVWTSLFVFAGLLSAQTATTGQMEGEVKDPSGALVAAAKVVLASEAGVTRETVTGESGAYLFTLLPPGNYRLQVLAQGFKTSSIDAIAVRITETSHVDIAMQVAAAAGEVVTVEAAEALVQTASPATGRTVDAAALNAVPLATRNFTQILGLSTGTATYLPDNTAVGRNSQNISVNGARVTNNNFVINGADANSIGTNSAPSLGVPAPETLEEFKVQTSMYDATFGRSGGGNIQVVTRSGQNHFHGDVYEYFRNDALNANDPFLKASGVGRPELKRNVWGATVGGPVRKDKMFFFLSYQGTRELNAASRINSLSSNVLIAPGLTDDRSEKTLLATFHPALAAGTAVASINPISLALLNAKLPNGQYVIPTPQAGGRYSGATASSYNEHQMSTSWDDHLSAANTLSAKFFLFDAPQTLVLPSFLGAGANVPGFGNNQYNSGRIVSLQDTHVISPRVINEARLAYSFLRVDAFPQQPVNDQALGIQRSSAASAPGLGMIQIAPAAGGIAFGTAPLIDVVAQGGTSLAADTISMQKGKHALRAGAEVRFNLNLYDVGFYTRGLIQFLSFNDFLTGNTFVSLYGGGIGRRTLRSLDYNFFAEDDWKVSRKLTLNLGLRYELDTPPYDTQGRLATFDPGLYQPRPATNGAAIGPPIAGYVQAGNVAKQFNDPNIPKVSKYVLKSIDPNNLAPRLGFAYSPLASDRVVVRGGYGIYYSRTSFQYATLGVADPPTYVFGVNVGAPFANPFFPVPAVNQFPTTVPGIALSGTFFDRNIRTPYMQQFNLGVQYAVGQTLLEATYVGSRGTNLFRQVGINQAGLASAQHPIVNAVTGAAITTNTPANAALRAPLQGVSVNGFFQDQATAQSVYHSLQASVTRRLAHGVQFLASYTFAKSLDNASGQGGGAGTGGVVNPGAVGETSGILGNQLDNRANRGISDFDRRQRFVLSGVWELPAPGFAGKGVGRALLHGWQISGVVTAMSGLPIDIVDTGAGSLYGLSGGSAPLARPNWAAGATAATAMSGTGGAYFNPLAFARPVVAAGQPIPSSGGAAIADGAGTDLGNVGRNVLRGPGQANVDCAVAKRFAIRERRSVELRADFFNLLNRVNLANPISDLNAVPASGGSINAATGQIVNPGSFGQIISASSNPRLIQLALKYRF